MNNIFADDEKLFRAVRPASQFWKKDGKPSSAAFKDKKGLSVNRAGDKTLPESIMIMLTSREGSIVSISVGDCKSVDALVKYCPLEDNPLHSEIHRNDTVAKLSDSQAHKLANMATIEYCAT